MIAGLPRRRAHHRHDEEHDQRRHRRRVAARPRPGPRSRTSARRAESKLLLVRGLDVVYGSVQVLFDVDLEVDEGEIVALLGTNGAGKSTLLKAISGVVEADRGAVIFDGREMTHAPPNEIAALGIRQVPGGQGVFPTLTVAENLRTARLAAPPRQGGDRGGHRARCSSCSRSSPTGIDEPAGNLSGGQQQMLALGMAFLSQAAAADDRRAVARARARGRRAAAAADRPRCASSGTTVILVEQSVNVALTVAETAYFMEKGEIRFHGPTAELLEPARRAALGVPRGCVDASSTASAATPNGDDERAEITRDDRPHGRSGAARPQGCRCSFGGIRAVDDVSLDVVRRARSRHHRSERRGKTTLFDLISGLHCGPTAARCA